MTRNKSPGEKSSGAESMASLVEGWLGNPVARRILGFLTERKNGERRIEKALKKYAKEKVSLSLGDRISYFIIEKILDNIGKNMGLNRRQIVENLKTGYWRKGLASVLEGIAWRGPKKPFTSYCPFLVVWNFTNAYNLNCKHCYQNADKPTPDELSTKEAIKAVDEMADAGVAYIAMSGGEPLFRNDFLK